MTPDVELAIYRIAQEALTDAVRHSGASDVYYC
jgi:signal transduction histidine kinase